MKNSSLFSILISLLILVSCAGDGLKSNVKKLADGVYQKEGWIYDMKELPSGKNVIPFYTVGTLSTNVLTNSFTNPPSEMGITLYFMLDKAGENKNKIISAYLESTATDENLFKFPRCLSICPVTVEILNPDGSVTEIKTSYSRPNVFRMDIEDSVLNDLAANQSKVRMRIPVSRNNQNTTFEWFDFDFAGYTPELD
ncbi:MAG: hypothetical protein P8O78_04155 [Flavobacteriaceae bacterium]|jgi:hypothetical protein|nr:hypothetical protein [Flavobacteriaceae bacterium]